MTDLATLVVKLEAQTAAYQQGLTQAQNQLKQFQGSVEGIFDSLKSVAIEFIGAAALEQFAQSIIENEQELDKLSTQTGIAVDQLSKLQYAASQNDVSNFTGDIQKLTKSIGEANNSNRQLQLDFEALGVSAADLKNLSVDQILKKMADGFAAASDGAGKAAVSTALMGRGGQDLIAFLNQGSEGIQKYMDNLDRLNGTVSKDAADKAHQFGQALGDIKAAADGVGQSIATALLPSLTDSTHALADFIAESAKASTGTSGLGIVVNVLAAALIGALNEIQNAGSEVFEIFQVLGKGIVGLAEVAASAGTGHFAAAKQIFIDNAKEIEKIEDDATATREARENAFSKAMSKLFGDEAKAKADAAAEGANAANAEILALIDSLSKKQIVLPDASSIKALETAISGLHDKAKDLDLSAGLSNTNEAMARVSLASGKLADDVKKAGAAGPELAAKYVAAAREVDAATANLTLSKMTQSLEQQIATFDGSKSAIDKYTLSLGVTAAQIKTLGPAGQAAVQQVLNLDKAFEALQLQQGLIQIDDQIQKLGNDTATSAGLLFDLAHQKDITNAQDLNDTADLAKIQHLKDLTVAQAQYNDLQKQASDIQANEALIEDAINRKVMDGAETELQGIADINAAREVEITKLTGVQTGLQDITDQYGKDIPELVLKTNQFKNSIADVQSKTKELANTLRNDFIDDANSAWTDFVTGAKSASDALKEFLDDFAKQILEMADKNLLQKLFQVDTSGGSGGTDIFSKLAGLLTGGAGGATVASGAGGSADVLTEVQASGLDMLAGGGAADAGTPYIVGEHGPEVMVPKTSGTVVPNGKWNGGQTIVNVQVMAPKGTVSQDTLVQTGASVSRSLQTANRRNN